MSTDERLQYMLQTPLKKILFSLAIPTIISNLISSFYNLADTYFVGQIGSESATGAIGIVFPIMSIMQAFGFMFGHGSGNYISRAMGAGKTKEAEKIAITGFVSAFACGLILMLVIWAFTEPIVKILGGTQTIAPYAKRYLIFLLPGIPFLVSSLVLNNQLRYQGNAFYAMIGIVSGAILNIVLDPIFIFKCNLGVAGAALATSLSQMVAFCVLLVGTVKRGAIKLKLKNLSINMSTYVNILKGGLPSLARQGVGSLGGVFLNVAASGYGDSVVAAMSIVSRCSMMASSGIVGFGQGFQPICGFNYGAKKYQRVIDCYWLAVKVTCGALCCISLLGFVFAPNIVSLFLKDNLVVAEIGAKALRFQCLSFPCFSFIIMSNMMLQTIGLTGKATLLAIGRQGIFLILSVSIFPPLLGVLGVQLAQPIADFSTFIMAVPIALGTIRKMSVMK